MRREAWRFWLSSEPDRPGWWWWRAFPTATPRIYKVTRSVEYKALWADTDAGSLTLAFMRQRWPEQQWAGPVPEPVEPGAARQKRGD